MSGSLAQVLGACLVYVAVVVVIGVVASRRSSGSPSEYFMAGRGLGTLVLFMALFGTNATSFVLVGIPARAYHDGVGIFSVNAPIIAFGIPMTFWAIGSPARAMAQRLGALTPAELYARRFGSRAVGVVLFLFFTAYTVPYMVQAVVASANMLEDASGGAISRLVGAVFVVLVSLFYTSLGGMRGTAWTNVFQGAVFLVFMVAAFALMSSSMGGLVEATRRVRDADPDLLRIAHGPLFSPGAFTSWSLVISLTVIGFPHMLARLMAAEDQASLKRVCQLYPLALGLLWIPAVMIGVWGAAELPGLLPASVAGPGARSSDDILYLMCDAHLPPLVGGLGFLAVLAAVMSTLDAQILTLSSMLVRDVGGTAERSERDARRAVVLGRVFAAAVAALVLVLSLTWTESVFGISRKAFEGYTTLVPALFCGVRWRRFTVAGAIVSILSGNLVLVVSWSELSSVAGFEWAAFDWLGFTAVFWALLVAAAAAVLVSLATRPTTRERIAAAFG